MDLCAFDKGQQNLHSSGQLGIHRESLSTQIQQTTRNPNKQRHTNEILK